MQPDKRRFSCTAVICKGYCVQSCTFVDKKCSEKPRSFHMGGSRWGGGTGGLDPPWNCQIINFCHVEIFRQTPSVNLDIPPPSIFSGSAHVPSMHRSALVRPLLFTCTLYKRELSEYKKKSNHLSTCDCAAPG